MESANPEVKLALAVERRLRRPATQLRALVAAAERDLLADTPLRELVIGPDLLAVLDALLAPLAPPAAAGRSAPRRGSPGSGPAALAVRDVQRPAAAPGGRGRDAVAPGVTTEAGRARRTWDVPAGGTAAETPPQDHRPGIAQRRADLRREIAAVSPVSAIARAQAQPLAEAPLLPTTGASHRQRAAPRHALIAAADRLDGIAAAGGAGGAPAEAVVAARSSPPTAAAGGHAGGVAATAAAEGRPRARAAAAEDQGYPDPGADAGTHDGARSEEPAARLPTAAALPHAGVASAVADSPPRPIAPRRSRAGVAVSRDDDAEAWAEAAWRNGMDLP